MQDTRSPTAVAQGIVDNVSNEIVGKKTAVDASLAGAAAANAIPISSTEEPMSQLRYDLFLTAVGWVGLLASDRGLRRLSLKPNSQEAMEELGPELEGAAHDPSSTVHIQWRLEKFLDGEAGALDDIDLDLAGAPSFFAAAWVACRRIPPGETRSYAWLAAEAGSPRAVRAAGQAMAKNPLALVIPCHRVIASNGDLRGYGAGGLGVKARLLQLERAAEPASH